jgi:uncharacterized protein (TIGR00369 family)
MSAPARTLGAVKLPPERTTTGIEFLKRMVAGDYPNIPMADHLGFRIVEAEPGRVVVAGRPDERCYNLMGSAHGGWAAAFLDTCMALAAMSTLDEDNRHTTLDIRINYLRPLTMEMGEVRGEGRLLQGGRRVAYCEGRLLDGEGKLVAHGTSSCLIFPR